MLTSVKVLGISEVVAVVNELRRRGRRSASSRLNLVLFRLSACCGLRVAELTGLTLANVRVGCDRPHLYVPATVAKGGKARMVPLWWDAQTLADIEAWKSRRLADGATSNDPFLCSTRRHRAGHGISRRAAQHRWDRIIRVVLGAERAECLSIHSGRHSFCSNALAAGKSLVEVRDAAGHASVATTNIYLHMTACDDEIGNIFAIEVAA